MNQVSRYIKVAGERVYFVVSEDGESLRLDESSSEQCEGCGIDIMESGARVPRAPKDEIRCACGSVYLIHEDPARDRWQVETAYTINPNDAESARRDRLPTVERRPASIVSQQISAGLDELYRAHEADEASDRQEDDLRQAAGLDRINGTEARR